MRHTTLLYFAIFVLQQTGADDVKSRVVNTAQGPVKGYKSTEGNFYAFFGIPYAGTPTGRDKFKPPLPAPIWLDTFEAVKKEIFCPQAVRASLGPDSIIDEKDCLIVNVFVPDTEHKNLPVVVWVHGGGYQVGSSNMFEPYKVLEEGKFIAVNFNYRVGVHGFLCLGTEDIPGNAGMKDQVAALRWVKKNIARFGGNPDDISLTGYSAGSSAVELLLLSETTKGLFNKVIPESGAALGVWSTQSDPLANAKRLAIQLNFTNVDEIYALEEFFKGASFAQLTADDFFTERGSSFVFEPCVERNTGSEMFLKEAPIDIVKKSAFPNLPILMGFANMEGHFRDPQFKEWKDAMNANFVDFVPVDLQFESEEEKEAVAHKIKQFYFGDKPVSEENIQAYYDFFSDVMFKYPTIRAIKYYLNAGNNVYLYEYSYVDDIILQTRQFPNVRGATHCAQTYAILELPSRFNFIINNTGNEIYNKMKQIMRRTWIDFYKTGKPVSAPTDDFPEGWPAVSSADGSPYMDLNLPCTLHRTPLLAESTKFWEEIYEAHYRKPIPPPELPPKRSEYSEL